ncbi:TonB-dependent siderophore receptor [Agrobacterium sp. S2]|nr:TonB-dependent siderophore receptor [Agrobacterium sp. S2]
MGRGIHRTVFSGTSRALMATLLVSTAIGIGLAVTYREAAAQTQAQTSFSVPAGPLNRALTAFGRQAGVQVTYLASAAAGKTSPGFSGSATREQALAGILAGSGLVYSFPNATTVAISTPASGSGNIAADGSTVLETITVQGQNDGTTGIVATRSSTGTKTDTPILETPQTVNVVTRKEMDDRGVTDFNSAVSYTPGIRAVDYPGGQGSPDIYIRGFRAFNLFALYKDGLRSGFNQYDTDIEQFAYERMDVLKGPSSVLYGQSAPGGLVNLTTKRPTETPIHEIQTTYGSYNRKQIGVDLGGPVTEDGTFLYRLTGLWRDSDTQIDHSPDDRLYIAPALTWQPTDSTSLTVMGSYQKTEKGGAEQSLPMVGTIYPYTTRTGSFPSSLFLGEPGVTHYDVENTTVGYEFNHEFDNGWTFKQNARYMHADVDYISSGYRSFTETTATFGFQDRPKSTDSFLIDNNISGSLEAGPLTHSLLFGLDYGYYDGSESRRGGTNHTVDINNPVYGAPVVWNTLLTTDTRSKVSQVGLYAQDQIKLDKWVLSLGGRYDHVRQTEYNFYSNTIWGIADEKASTLDNAFTGRVGLTYLFDNGFAPYVSYATSFQPSSGVDYNGNMFEPTTGEQWEAGVKYQPLGWNGFFSASVFQITQQNVTTTDPVNIGYSVQEGEVRSRGFELEAKTELTDGLSLTAGYAYTDARVTQDNENASGVSKVGTRLQSSPYHQASLWLDYEFQQEALLGLKIGSGIRYVGNSMAPINTSTGSQVKVPGYTLLDASISYDFGAKNPDLKGLSLAVSGTNLTDEKYFTPGFYSNTVFYGNRRTVNATLSYKW